MNRYRRYLPGLVLAIMMMILPGLAVAQDMRADHRELAKKKAALVERATRELQAAQAAAREKQARIQRDEKALKAALAALKRENKSFKKEIKGLEKNIKIQNGKREKLETELTESMGETRELSGFIRSNAKDLENLLNQSLQSALVKDRGAFLPPLINQERFPSMADIRKMADVFFGEIQASGEVRMSRAPIIDRQGREVEARVLSLGNFTGIYDLDGEIGFLLYSDKSQRFFALSRLPSPEVKAALTDYLNGKTAQVPMDITQGGALRSLTHELSLVDQVPKGGPIVWPILALLAMALVILAERAYFFLFRRIKVETFMKRVREFVDREEWEACQHYMASFKGSLIPKVLAKALPFRDQSRQDMENALQEAILGEIPRIERFLSTLGMLAAIAPLMGLLGTVTGMINTFHTITYYGAGDPRMMSGGISEALVTTMLGLAVAIPIMLFHTFLNRRVETQINQMEEKAVSFVNMVFKARNECRPVFKE
ncbi:MAG: MotA/TolQ/ExbB proton channel family protein [Desulfobacterales bacterium]|nr:MotA/TolQ/ExbB proton channel family protein [Desulfobacterales bacterium]